MVSIPFYPSPLSLFRNSAPVQILFGRLPIVFVRILDSFFNILPDIGCTQGTH